MSDSHTSYIPQDHPAVSAVACPYCEEPAGAPCRPTGARPCSGFLGRSRKRQGRGGTHLARVQAWNVGQQPVTTLPAQA